jgi:AcrR family transcriptional regulator
VSPTRAYRSRSRATRPSATRERIVAAVDDLLAEGGFHEATVEEVAERAGVSRATLYQHFGSRLGLVDAICETFARSAELQALKAAVEADELDAATDGLIAAAAAFWAAQEHRLVPLYGVAAVDPAAERLVERQRRDRRRVVVRLVERLTAGGRLRPGVGKQRAVALLLVLTSFETYLELRRHAGLAEREVVRILHGSARTELLAGGG